MPQDHKYTLTSMTIDELLKLYSSTPHDQRKAVAVEIQTEIDKRKKKVAIF